jgi:hypothetical protein
MLKNELLCCISGIFFNLAPIPWTQTFNKMKPAILGAALLLLLSTIQAQSTRTIPVVIPDNVMDKFTLLYPDATGVIWKEQKGKYLAEFKNDKRRTAAIIRSDGSVVQTKTQIKVIALPPDATTFLMEEVKVKKIEDAAIIEDDPGIITFTVIADKEEYWFDGEGHLVSSYGMFIDTREE